MSTDEFKEELVSDYIGEWLSAHTRDRGRGSAAAERCAIYSERLSHIKRPVEYAYNCLEIDGRRAKRAANILAVMKSGSGYHPEGICRVEAIKCHYEAQAEIHRRRVEMYEELARTLEDIFKLSCEASESWERAISGLEVTNDTRDLRRKMEREELGDMWF